MFTDVLPMFTDVYPMVTDFYRMIVDESSLANPQKIAKIVKISEKCKKYGLATLYLPRNYPVIREIGSHRCHRLIIGYRWWHRRETRYIAAHREQS
jgi:hypothetical protein